MPVAVPLTQTVNGSSCYTDRLMAAPVTQSVVFPVTDMTVAARVNGRSCCTDRSVAVAVTQADPLAAFSIPYALTPGVCIHM